MQSIRKPDIDEREYRLITLRNNLEAMIISDPKANQCKISLVVALARRARGPSSDVAFFVLISCGGSRRYGGPTQRSGRCSGACALL
jgi:hypothetical protein